MESEKKEEHSHKVHHQKDVSKKFPISHLYYALIFLLGVIIILNIIFTSSLNSELKKNIEAAKERSRPANIELTVIKNSKCSDCFDISALVGGIKAAKVKITKESITEYDSKAGKEITARYNIERIPAIIVTGELDKFSMNGLEKKNDALVLSRIEPPYTDPATGKIEGRVTLYQLKDPSCAKCSDLSPLIKQMKASGIKFTTEKSVDTNSDEGKGMVQKYKLEFVPTIVLSKDAGAYALIQKAWPQVGTKESDGSYVLRLVSPPFKNLTNGQLRGIVDVIYLSDKSCTECYDVNIHKEILANPQSFAVAVDKEDKYDISDAKGQELVAKYNITSVPTVIVSNQLSAYPSLQVLKQFFSAEKDGSYVFRQVQVIGTYKNLATNIVVKAQQRSQGQ